MAARTGLTVAADLRVPEERLAQLEHNLLVRDERSTRRELRILRFRFDRFEWRQCVTRVGRWRKETAARLARIVTRWRGLSQTKRRSHRDTQQRNSGGDQEHAKAQ